MMLLQICDKKSDYAQSIVPHKLKALVLYLKLETIVPYKGKALNPDLKLEIIEPSPKASFL